MEAALSKTTPRVLGDTRGAILILGVVMGTLLVGALWHVASLGDAIIWREQAQDAADAAAFENAVWNARGMNVLVIMNILMSALMFMILVYRALILLLGALTVLSYVACLTAWLPTGISQLLCPAAPFLTQATRFFVSKEQNFFNGVSRVMVGIMKAEKVVATAAPALGVVTAASSTKDAYDVDLVAPFSASLLPTVDQWANGGSGARFSNVRGRVAKRIGWVVSLPVQEDGYTKVCAEAVKLLPDQMIGLLDRAGAPDEIVTAWRNMNSVLDMVTGALDGIFCKSASEIPEDLLALRTRTINDKCDRERTEGREEVDGRPMWPDPENDRRTQQQKEDGVACTPPDCQLIDNFSTRKCRQRYERENELNNVGASKKPEEAKPAKVWDYATNGNVFMQSWAMVRKSRDMLERNDEGLELADQQRTGSLVEEEDEGTVWAQAEMFYDCEGDWTTCGGNAMWTIRWKARLRRIQDIESMAGQAASRMIAEGLLAGLSHVNSRLTQSAEDNFNIPHVLTAAFHKKVDLNGKARRWLYGDPYRQGQRAIRGDPSRNTLIH
jgi:hypothetical protein